jgi:hypothetical protein
MTEGVYVSDSHGTVNWLTWRLWQRKLTTNLTAMTEGAYVSDSHDTVKLTLMKSMAEEVYELDSHDEKAYNELDSHDRGSLRQ